MPNNKGVIINVYKESKTPKPNHKNNPMIKKINPKLLLLSSKTRRVFKTRAYDRRAQLLAYTRELRHANAHAQLEQKCPFNNSRSKPKKWTHKMRAFFPRFEGMKRRWKYEPIVTDDYSDDSNQERVKSKRTRNYSHFCNKLRCYLKKIWQCKNGGC